MGALAPEKVMKLKDMILADKNGGGEMPMHNNNLVNLNWQSKFYPK